MRIDLGSNTKFEVQFEGEVYVLREPTARDVKKLKKDSGEEDSNLDAFEDFIIDLGMPKEIAKSLGISKIKVLAESILAGFSEKK